MRRVLSENIRLLIVDDDETILREFKSYIELRIPHTYIAKDAKEALEQIEKHSPHVVLTDINMPGMDGIELCRIIKAKDPEVYVTAVTAHSDMDYLLNAFDAGFDNYLIKPVSAQRIKEILDRAVKKEELTRTVIQQRDTLEQAYSIAGISSFLCPGANLDTVLQADHFFDSMFGIDHTTLTLREFLTRHLQDGQLADFLSLRAEKLEKKEPFEIELGMRKADGTPLEVLLICKPRFDEAGKLLANHVVLKDVTSIKTTLRKAEYREMELSLLLDTIPDGAWSWNLKEHTLFLTPRWKEMLGYEDHELPHHPDTFFKRLHPEDLPGVEEAVQEHLEKRNGYYEKRFRLLCKDGSYKWIKARGKAIFDKDGNPEKFLGLHEDLGAELRAEKAEKEVAVYEKIFSSSRDGLLYLDKERHIRAANESFLRDFMLKKEEVIGKKPEEVHGHEFYDQFVKSDLEKCLRGETVVRTDWYDVPTGKRYKQVVHIPYYEYGTENIEGVVVNVQEMTDWKKAETQLLELTDTLETKVEEKLEELREKDQMMIQQGRFAAMGEMLSMIAHQWRQPLNAVSAASINLKLFSEMGSLTPDMIQQQCSFIEQQSLQMSQTINDFMSFFRPDKEKKAFILKECIEKVEKMIQPQLKTHSIRLVILQDQDIMVYGVRNEMEHILLNLLTNARDVLEEKNPGEKVITLKTHCEEKHVTVLISDTGGGIPEEIIHKIFDPYFTTKPQGKGTGIGLYMSKIIVEQHFEGKLDVVNNEKGAEFQMTVPLVESC